MMLNMIVLNEYLIHEREKTIKVLAESNSSISFKKQNLRVLFMIKMLPIEGFSKYLSVKSTSLIPQHYYKIFFLST